MILCIDDEPKGLQVRQMVLESEGYRVLTATSVYLPRHRLVLGMWAEAPKSARLRLSKRPKLVVTV